VSVVELERPQSEKKNSKRRRRQPSKTTAAAMGDATTTATAAACVPSRATRGGLEAAGAPSGPAPAVVGGGDEAAAGASAQRQRRKQLKRQQKRMAAHGSTHSALPSSSQRSNGWTAGTDMVGADAGRSLSPKQHSAAATKAEKMRTKAPEETMEGKGGELAAAAALAKADQLRAKLARAHRHAERAEAQGESGVAAKVRASITKLEQRLSQLLLLRPSAVAAAAAAVSYFCACIGSPCLRPGVHGASIQ
jgi:hypothetical protein